MDVELVFTNKAANYQRDFLLGGFCVRSRSVRKVTAYITPVSGSSGVVITKLQPLPPWK